MYIFKKNIQHICSTLQAVYFSFPSFFFNQLFHKDDLFHPNLNNLCFRGERSKKNLSFFH